jgi:hypothetical protein
VLLVLSRLRRRKITGTMDAVAPGMSASGAGTAVGGAWHVGTSKLSITGRFALLEQRLNALRDQVSGVDHALRTEVNDRIREIYRLRIDLNVQVARLDTSLRTQQERAEEIDAHALPIIAWGLLLSEFSDWLVAIPAIGVVGFSIGMALLVLALYLLGVRRKPSAT